MNNTTFSEFSQKMHLIGCDVSNPEMESILRRILSLKSLALPPVCLPDLLLKPRVEAPASFAAATFNTIVPELTAPSIGCGMGIAKTSLTRSEVDTQFFERFLEEMRGKLGPRYGVLKNCLLWAGLLKRPKQTYDLSREEFEHVIREGAPAVVEKYGFFPSLLDAIEYRGSLFPREEQNRIAIHRILPRVSFKTGMHDLGYGFKGNHFLELQYVEEILDHATAQKWGITLNQVMIMFHGGGGTIPYHVGRYYGNRKKNTFRQKIGLLVFKTLFHFGSWEGIKNFRQRFRLYILPRPFTEIPAQSNEGRRLMHAMKAALNYSYAFRVAMLKRINDSVKKAAANPNAHVTLVWDAVHNSILPETINGENVIAHRHTANRAYPGRPLIVSGFNTTCSYLAVALPEAEKKLFSADHGAGGVIKRFEEKGISCPHPDGHKTLIYQTPQRNSQQTLFRHTATDGQAKKPLVREAAHITDEGINHVMNHLAREGIARPVVRLRPLAVFKG